MISKQTLGRLLAIVAVLVVPACKKSPDTLDPNRVPDLNQQVRPYVTLESTKVRTGPGADFRTIGEIKPNSRVNVVGRDGDWLLIMSKKGNAPGFIEIASVKPSSGDEQESSSPPIEGKYEVLMNTQLRSGPGLHYPTVANLTKGTAINVVHEEKGWLRVESKRGNRPGYIDATLARRKATQ